MGINFEIILVVYKFNNFFVNCAEFFLLFHEKAERTSIDVIGTRYPIHSTFVISIYSQKNMNDWE